MINIFKELNKKGESETPIRNILIAIILFLFFFIGMTGWIYSSVDSYNVTISERDNELFKNINSTYADLDQSSRNLQKQTESTSTFTAVDNVITTGGALLDAIKLFFVSIPIISYMINIVLGFFGLPSIQISLLVMAILITITLMIWSVIRGMKS